MSKILKQIRYLRSLPEKELKLLKVASSRIVALLKQDKEALFKSSILTEPFEVRISNLFRKAFKDQSKEVFKKNGAIIDELFSKPFTDPPPEMAGKVPLWYNQQSYENFISQIQTQYGTEWAEEIRGESEKMITQMYHSSQTLTSNQFKYSSVGLDNIVDKPVIDVLEKQNNFWLKDAPSKTIGPQINSKSVQLINQGYGQKELKEELKNSIGGMINRSDWYWNVLSADVMNRARNFATINEFHKIGFEVYELVAVLDERTTEICRYMNGRVFTVEKARELIQETIDAGVPSSDFQIDKLKNIRPWVRFSAERAKTGWNALYVKQGAQKFYLPDSKFQSGGKGVWTNTGAFNDSKTNKELSKMNLVLPPFHGLCRTWAEATYDEITEPGATFNIPIDVKPENTAFAPFNPDKDMKGLNQSVGGMHSKWLFEDKAGDKWMFKPGSGNKDFQAWGEYMVNKFKKDIGMVYPETYVANSRGQFGSIQKFLPNNGFIEGTRAIRLTKAQCLDVQKEHVIDFLFSNHDGHGGNLGFLKNGKVFGIDKGQAFKFFPKDSLKLDYNPNKSYGVHSYYNKGFFDRYAAGDKVLTTKFANKEFQGFLGEITKYSDDAYRQLLTPYYDSLKKAGFAKLGKEEFLTAAIARKNGIKNIMGSFYKDIEAQRKLILAPLAEEKPSKVPAISNKGAVTKIDKKFTVGVEKSGAYGKSIMISGDTFENMNLLAYEVKGLGTMMHGKIRLESQGKLMKVLNRNPVTASPIPRVNNFDPHYQKVLKAAKSINYHMNPTSKGYDGAIPPHTNALVQQLQADLKFLKKTDTAALHYSEVANKMLLQVLEPKSYSYFEVKQYDPAKLKNPPKPTALKAAQADFKVTKTNRFHSFKYNGDTRKTEVAGEAMWDSTMYKIEKDGITAWYVQHGNSNRFSRQGQFFMNIGKNDLASYKKGLKFIEELGLDNKLATAKDMEYLFLKKATWSNHSDQILLEEQRLIQSGQLKTLDERIEYYQREMANSKFGGSIEKMKASKQYKFKPKFANDESWAYWEKTLGRTELTTAQSNDNYAGAALTTKGATKLEQLKNILGAGKSARMLPTEERFRMGIRTSTMSQSDDQIKGGANFAFTRVYNKVRDPSDYYNGRKFDIEFNTKAIHSQLDNRHYTYDKYGEQRYRDETKASDTINDFHKKKSTDYSNELIVKNGIPIDNYIKKVRVGQANEKLELIEHLNARGITEFNGIDLDKLIEVGYY